MKTYLKYILFSGIKGLNYYEINKYQEKQH